MRGRDEQTGALFSYLSPDALISRAIIPLRAVRLLLDAALDKLSAQFDALYSPGGRVKTIRPPVLADPPAQASGHRSMTNSSPPAVFGRWRITEIEGWDAGYVNMVGPGYIQFDQDGGQAEFGAVQLSLDCWFGQAGAYFNFQGSDEGTDVSGEGDAELEEDGTLQGEIRFHNGDDMPFIARRW